MRSPPPPGIYHTSPLPGRFWINSTGTRVQWSSKSKGPELSEFRTADIKEVRLGRTNTAFQRAYAEANGHTKRRLGGEDATGCFSLLVGETYEPLNLVAVNPDVFNAWILGLQYLIHSNQQLSVATSSAADQLRMTARDQWLEEIFARGDVNGDKELSLPEVTVLLKSLNLHLPRRRLRKLVSSH